MSESLADTVALYAAGLALLSLATAVRGRSLGRAHAAAAVVLGAGAALDALVALAGLATGEHAAEPIPFAATCSSRCSPCRWAGATRARRRAGGTPPRSRSPPARCA